jgi:hypothetical protein
VLDEIAKNKKEPLKLDQIQGKTFEEKKAFIEK